MKTNRSNLLTDTEFVAIIFGIIAGTGIFAMPSGVVAIAKQDAWIAVFIGALYPLYIVLMAKIISNKYPGIAIMDLSKLFFGKILGNFLNFLFAAQWIFYATTIISGASNILITYAVWFMSPQQLALVFTLLLVYGASKGLNTIAKINVFGFWVFILVLATSGVAFIKGNLLNLQPVFSVDLQSLLKAGIQTAYPYTSIEMLLILPPYLKNKDKLVKLSLITVCIVIFVYLWAIITSLVYWGPDIVPKAFWPIFFVSESIQLIVISNFKFILIILWPIIYYRTLLNNYYASVTIMNNIAGGSYKVWCIVLSPIVLFPSLHYQNEVARRNLLDHVVPWITVFLIIYVTLIAVMVLIKGKANCPLQDVNTHIAPTEGE